MEEMLVNLFRLCMEAKECGIDAFFGYRPHINSISLEVNKNGWGYKLDEHGNRVYNKELEIFETTKPDKELLIPLCAEDVENQINEIYTYINDCIIAKEKAPQGPASE